jgi:hypothetical protein
MATCYFDRHIDVGSLHSDLVFVVLPRGYIWKPSPR